MRYAPRPGRVALVAAFVALSLVGSSLAWTESVAAAGVGPAGTTADDLLPDLEMLPIYGVLLKTTKNGSKRIRFGTRALNVGAGPLEVRGRDRNVKRMREIYQYIHDIHGGGREVLQPEAAMFWSGDGHNHWHVDRFMTVEFYKIGRLDQTRRIRKLGFCLMDSLRGSGSFPNAPDTRVYGAAGCGKKYQLESIAMGISVGWADDYPPMIKYQWIDITKMPKGVYRLCAKVNPLGWWLEASPDNNYHWLDVWVNRNKTKFEIRGSGTTACGSYT